jgi:hypothetical protein
MDRALQLEGLGLLTEALGPQVEWSPVPPTAFQRRHDMFWRVVAAVLESEPGTYDDLPEYLTESATEQLQANN